MNGVETVTALRSAFDALSGIAASDQVAPVLRQALLALLTAAEPEAGQKPASKKNRRLWAGDLETRAPMRDKIRTILNTRDISHRGLATELRIPHTMLRPSLLPHGHAPSRANIVRLQRWLEATESQTVTKSRSNGHAYQLTKGQREQLAGYRQLDEQTVRHQTGDTLEVIGTKPWPATRSHPRSSTDWSAFSPRREVHRPVQSRTWQTG